MKIDKYIIHSEIRGNLFAIDFDKLPFEPKRSFLVYGVPEGFERGNHAHINTNQYLICLNGILQIKVNNGKTENSIYLTKGDGVLIDKMIWDSQIFYGNAILLVLCDTNYDGNDYIRDYEKYKDYCNLLIKH